MLFPWFVSRPNVGHVWFVEGLQLDLPHDPCHPRQVTNHEDRAVLRAFLDEHSASPRKDFRSKGQPPWIPTDLDWPILTFFVVLNPQKGNGVVTNWQYLGRPVLGENDDKPVIWGLGACTFLDPK